MLATSRVVKIKDGGLREIIARTQAQRVERISFHLNGSTIECGCEEGNGATASRLSRRKGHFFAWNNPLRRLGEGNKMGFRAATA
jgi:hypothetical protein